MMRMVTGNSPPCALCTVVTHAMASWRRSSPLNGTSCGSASPGRGGKRTCEGGVGGGGHCVGGRVSGHTAWELQERGLLNVSSPPRPPPHNYTTTHAARGTTHTTARACACLHACLNQARTWPVRTHPWQVMTHPWQVMTHPYQTMTHPWQVMTHPWQAMTHPWQLMTHPWQLMTHPWQLMTHP